MLKITENEGVKSGVVSRRSLQRRAVLQQSCVGAHCNWRCHHRRGLPGLTVCCTGLLLDCYS